MVVAEGLAVGTHSPMIDVPANKNETSCETQTTPHFIFPVIAESYSNFSCGTARNRGTMEFLSDFRACYSLGLVRSGAVP